ncbi:MAG: hypothetical protein DLM54_00130 [Acidimicrobiales bacterium]|nr:MAG: hypothetical protein DLM54_00130 [Acidimicrobiales bacterium]
MLGVLSPLRLARRVVVTVVVVLVIYLLVTAVQVWLASRRDEARPAQAIVVLGAAQYNGLPSPDLAARLSHALGLWRQRLAPRIVVTGGGQPGDRYTEASASADYLLARGVPESDLLREVEGRNTYESLAATAAFLHQRGISQVVLVSDPFHMARVGDIAGQVGLTGYTSPTQTSPISGTAVVPYFAKETAAVALGRVIGFRRLEYLHPLVGAVRGRR